LVLNNDTYFISLAGVIAIILSSPIIDPYGNKLVLFELFNSAVDNINIL
jgi:hypothetical protein